jgi:hypothetical protein
MRKPIQITTTGKGALIALCNDGSLFRMTSQGWNQLEPIPQPEKKTTIPQKRFIPPTLNEIKSVAVENGYSVDCEAFYCHYEGNGWMVGKNKMKNWKMTLASWNKRESKPTQRSNLPAGLAKLKEMAR